MANPPEATRASQLAAAFSRRLHEQWLQSRKSHRRENKLDKSAEFPCRRVPARKLGLERGNDRRPLQRAPATEALEKDRGNCAQVANSRSIHRRSHPVTDRGVNAGAAGRGLAMFDEEEG